MAKVIRYGPLMIPWKLREGSLRALQDWAAAVSELIKIHEWENNQQLVTPFTALSVGKSIHGYLPPSRRCGQLLCLSTLGQKYCHTI